MTAIKGLDLSKHQKGLSITAVKNAGYQFAILRGGYTGYGKTRDKNKDSEFENFYAQAKKIGFPVGAYYYSCANNKQGGIDEAKFLYANCLKGKQFEYPIYIDVENDIWQTTDKTGVTDAIIGFCETLENLGYYVGIYAALSWFENRIETARLDDYTKWVAAWRDSKPNFKYSAFDMWQNSDNGVIGTHIVDTDYCFKDFPRIIKAAGLNGFPKKKTLDEIAREVIAGKWGSGTERKTALEKAGYDYYAVQSRVNQLLKG